MSSYERFANVRGRLQSSPRGSSRDSSRESIGASESTWRGFSPASNEGQTAPGQSMTPAPQLTDEVMSDTAQVEAEPAPSVSAIKQILDDLTLQAVTQSEMLMRQRSDPAFAPHVDAQLAAVRANLTRQIEELPRLMRMASNASNEGAEACLRASIRLLEDVCRFTGIGKSWRSMQRSDGRAFSLGKSQRMGTHWREFCFLGHCRKTYAMCERNGLLQPYLDFWQTEGIQPWEIKTVMNEYKESGLRLDYGSLADMNKEVLDIAQTMESRSQ